MRRKKMTGKSLMLILSFWAISYMVCAQSNEEVRAPIFTPAETKHDFGTIGENDGYAEHIFKFKNTGTAPLNIVHVQVTCGCTKPEWSNSPVEPGQEGFIIITYNPKGHLGPFNKPATVYTNENGGVKQHRLDVIGVVVEKPSDPGVAFQDKFGGMGIEKKNLTFKTFIPEAVNRMALYIKNYNDETVYFVWENLPDYITIQAPDSLKADWPGEIILAVDGTKTAHKRGRLTDNCTWIVKNREGKILGSEQISVTVNYLDDFSKLSPLQSVTAPALDIKNTMINFGQVKKGILGIGGTANKPFILTNNGKSDLIIHSITGDDKRVHLPSLNGKTIKAGESFTVNATIKAKEFGPENIDTDIYVVCNDPKGPIRLIKVMAEKID